MSVLSAPERSLTALADLERVDGRAKVEGSAAYAADVPAASMVYCHVVQSSIARGSLTRIDTDRAEALSGVLVVLTHDNAPRLVDIEDAEVFVLQTPAVAYRGQIVAAVVADTPETARLGADLIDVSYQVEPAAIAFGLDEPVQPQSAAEIDRALAAAPVRLDVHYATPPEHHVAMEPHAAAARWADGRLALQESTQGVHHTRDVLARLLDLPPDHVLVSSRFVGGAFGSKIEVHPHTVTAALAALALPGRTIRLVLTRQQCFALAGYRSPTRQRIRLGAATDGQLQVVAVDVAEQTSRTKEFAENCQGPAARMYASVKRHTSNRQSILDVPIPTWMRGPGCTPGMFALEAAMDELAIACAVDPVELRIHNEPLVDPESGKPFPQRRLVNCLRVGAERFGWEERDPTPRARRRSGWWIGTGVSSATYPHARIADNAARIRFQADGRYLVEIAAADIGTGSRTALAVLAADALGVPPSRVEVELGVSDLPEASVAGGSFGTTSWGAAVIAAARAFRAQHGTDPGPGAESQARGSAGDLADRSAHSFGAQFAEVRIREDTGEIRVTRLLGVFSVGRVVNARTARSQFVGGMTMGIGMALHEEGVWDSRYGLVVNHDLAGYHIPTCADVEEIEVVWLDEDDPDTGARGIRGVGEIGITGVAAAIANAAHHATGVRVRRLPLTVDDFLS